MGGDLFIDERGSGEAVVLLHGVPTSPDDFAPLADALADGHRVFVPHLPGYGRSPLDPQPYSLAATVACLERGLGRLGISGAAVVAISGGAYKAVAMALGRHLNVSRLVLLSPAIGFDPPVATAHRDMVSAVRSGALDPRTMWLERMASPGYAERDPSGAARVLAWLDAAPLSLVCDELLALADAVDLRPRVPELACPLLVCAGTADSAVPASSSKAVAASAQRSVFVPFDGAGHALLVEASVAAVRVIVDFLGER
jgi:pimeloyl-ACP methyl ester carboxylesterase